MTSDAAPHAASLHTTEVGTTGERVVFLHGLFGQGRNFTGVAKALEPDLRSVLVDLPNHGRSAWTGSVDYEEVADVVADWMRASGAGEPAHLVGHSMGGKVAMLVALRHPELVDRLVVVDISPATSDGAGEFEHLLDSLVGLDLAAVERRADADAALAERIPDDRVRGFLLQNLRSVPGGGWRWQADLALLRREMPTIAGFPDVDAVFDHPVLWMAGERSPYVRPEHEPTMRRLFPRTTAVTIKGAGHWVHSEQPKAFASALRVFLLAPDRPTPIV